MKKIIDGKIYNTDTAALIGELECTYNHGDFHYHDTALYRSPRGAYFLAGDGNAYSMWGHAVGDNGRGGGSGLCIINKSDARYYAEQMDLSEEEMLDAGFDLVEG